MSTFKDLLRIDLGGKWYVQILKILIALVGGYLLVVLLAYLASLILGIFGFAFR
jgi:hypothetical protein